MGDALEHLIEFRLGVPLLEVLAEAQHEVGVTVDQAGQDGGTAEVDDRGARRRPDPGGIADGGDAVSLDEDSRVGDWRSARPVDQGPAADHGKHGHPPRVESGLARTLPGH